MPLRSMTGYGRGLASGAGIRVGLELNSVNRKQLEVRLNLPRALAALESRMVEQIQKAISRGQVSGTVTVQVAESLRRQGVRVDAALAAAYAGSLRKTAATLGLADDLSASLLLQWPGVVTFATADEDTNLVWPVLRKALTGALAGLVGMRTREGTALAADLKGRLGRLDGFVGAIHREAPAVTARYRQALMQRLKQSGVPLGKDDPLLARELAVFADRCDVSEELTRLDSHLKQARGLLTAKEPAGRTLDFLAQEMFREINTIGSKANEIRITRQVIAFKTELERIREQVQNVE